RPVLALTDVLDLLFHKRPRLRRRRLTLALRLARLPQRLLLGHTLLLQEDEEQDFGRLRSSLSAFRFSLAVRVSTAVRRRSNKRRSQAESVNSLAPQL